MLTLDLASAAGPASARIVRAAVPHLAWLSDPLVAFLGTGELDPATGLPGARAAFAALARVEPLDPARADFVRVLERADLLYAAAGNPYMSCFRLRAAGVFEALAARVQEGLPVVACSAGTVMAGPDILNSTNTNPAGLTEFAGWGAVPWSLTVHYPPAGPARDERDARIANYLAFQGRPVLALDDDARLAVRGDQIELLEGAAFEFRPGEAVRPFERLPVGPR